MLRQIALFKRSLKLIRSKGIMTSAMYVPSLCSLQDVLIINAGLLHISLLIKKNMINIVIFHQFSNKQVIYIMSRICSVIFTKSVLLSFHFVLLKTFTKLTHLATTKLGRAHFIFS